jgi:hypothetical protein
VAVANTCNPSYSGGRDQEDPSLKPITGKQLARPYLKKKKKNHHKKNSGEVAQGVGPEFKP